MIISEKKKSCCSSKDAASVINSILAAEDEVSRDREHFYAIGLNVKNVIQYVELVSLGSLSASIVHPRELFRFAVTKGIAAMIVGHNHPSGDTKPSQEDILLTKRIKDASKILGIELLDHVIVGNDSHFSFRDNGLM